MHLRRVAESHEFVACQTFVFIENLQVVFRERNVW